MNVETQRVGLDGRPRIGHVPVTGGTPVEAAVPAWLDPDGAVVEAPPGGFEAAGTFSGIGVLLAGGSVLAFVWIGVKRARSTRERPPL